MNDCGGTGLYSILSSTDGLRRRTNYNDNYREITDVKVPKLFSADFDDDLPSILMPPTKSVFPEERSNNNRAYSTWATREDMWAARSDYKKIEPEKTKKSTEDGTNTRIKVNRLTQNKNTDPKYREVKKLPEDTPVIPDDLFTNPRSNTIYPFGVSKQSHTVASSSTSSDRSMEYPAIQPRITETNAKEVVINFEESNTEEEVVVSKGCVTTEPEFVPTTLTVVEPVINIPIIRLSENPTNVTKPCLVSIGNDTDFTENRETDEDDPNEIILPFTQNISRETLPKEPSEKESVPLETSSAVIDDVVEPEEKYIKKIDSEKYNPKSNTYISDKSQNQHKMTNKGEKFNTDSGYASEKREPLFSVATTTSSSSEQLDEPIVWPTLSINEITTSFKVVGDLQKGAKLRVAEQKYLEVESSYFPTLTRGKFQSRKTIISFLNHMFSETKRTSYELLENIRKGVDTDTNVTSLSTFIYKMSIFLHRFETMRSAYEADSNTYSQLGNIRDDFFSFYHNFYRDMTIAK